MVKKKIKPSEIRAEVERVLEEDPALKFNHISTRGRVKQRLPDADESTVNLVVDQTFIGVPTENGDTQDDKNDKS